jgi:hypothetical protein
MNVDFPNTPEVNTNAIKNKASGSLQNHPSRDIIFKEKRDNGLLIIANTRAKKKSFAG